jgi:formamidopyrimidine-DNA glycosylase
MPELPDVATFERYLDATALHQEIAEVEVREARLLADLSPGELARGLTGHQLAGTRRHGKYLFAFLDEEGDGALVLHFGMTGTLRYYERDAKEPEHARVLIRFANGSTLAVVSLRLLGEVNLTGDVDDFVAAKELGPDALHDVTDEAALREALAGHRGMLKPALMNQGIVAGIGNVYGDEILFQARLDPRVHVDELADAELGRLFRAVREVLVTAADRAAEPADVPDGWLTARREPGATCPRCGGTIERIEVSGRAGYWCPSCQRRDGAEGDRG